MSMRLGTAVAIMAIGALLAACEGPAGDVILEKVGGDCPGGCDDRRLRRDGDELHWVVEEGRRDEVYGGRWTETAVTEYLDASAEVDADLPLDLDSCAAADGIDTRVTLEAPDGDLFDIVYCTRLDPPPSVLRVDALFQRTITALEERSEDPYVEL